MESEDADIKAYKRDNIEDYVRSNMCYEDATNLKVTKDEWLVMVQGYEQQLNISLFPLKRCFSTDKFNTVVQNDYGNEVKGCKDFFVYFFCWVKENNGDVTYLLSGIRVKHSGLAGTKGWFSDGDMVNHKITKLFIHQLAKQTILQFGGGK